MCISCHGMSYHVISWRGMSYHAAATCSGVAEGYFCRICATTPVACGHAIEVPDSATYLPHGGSSRGRGEAAVKEGLGEGR